MGCPYSWDVFLSSVGAKTPYIVGFAALIYSGFGFWRPSFWTDEAATLSAVRRSFPDLIAMLGNIDVVHGAYYILMFGWTRLFGFSEVALRLPSLLAVSCSAVLIVELGRRLSGTTFGVVAAALLTVLPRTQYVATDARSYGLTLLGAVTATFLLVVIRERPTVAKWIAYALVGAVTVAFSFYCVFLYCAHALTLVLDARLRPSWRGWLVSSVAWIGPAVFIGVLASRQQFQISWIRDVGPAFPFEFVFVQFFSDAYFAKDGGIAPTPTAGESFSMIALAVVIWTAAVTGTVLYRRHFLVLLAMPWLLCPAVAVIGASLITGGNYYLPRYLTFILPAIALLAAAPVLKLLSGLRGPNGKYRLTALATAASMLVLCLPSYLGQRTQYGRDRQDDFRFISESVKKLGDRGDAFVMSPVSDLAYLAYPDSFTGLGDPTLGITAAEWGRIFNQRFDVTVSADRIRQYRTVILVEKTSQSTMASALQKLGYVAAEVLDGPSTTITRYSLR